MRTVMLTLGLLVACDPASEPTIDVEPISKAIEVIGSENTRQLESDQEFKRDFNKVCERQITAIELMLPIVEGVKMQNDTFNRMKELLEHILDCSGRPGVG